MPSLPGSNLLPESKARPPTSTADPKPKPKFRRLGTASAASVAPFAPSSSSSSSSSSAFAAFSHVLSRAPPAPLIALITVISTALLFHVFTVNVATTSPAALARSPLSSVSAKGSVPLTAPVRHNGRQLRRPAMTVVRRTTRKILSHVYAHDHDGTHPDFRRLVVYNRPPQPGSVAVSRALSSEARRRGLATSRCFVRPELNAMALRTILNNNNMGASSQQQQQQQKRVDVYTCRLQLSKARYRALQEQRGHNVTFMTSTVDPVVMVTASYLERVFGTAAGINASEWIHKVLSSSATLSDERDNSSKTGNNVHTNVIKGFRTFVKQFPVGALYDFHGADEDFALTECPTRYEQMASLRRIVSRYEAVIDLDRPAESAALVDIVTDGGLKPDFDTASTTTTAVTTALMLRQKEYREHSLINGLLQVAQNLSSTHLCGHQLVHGMLVQQFNLIKDRLLQNRCFDEDSGTFRLCELMPLHRDNMRERTRDESFAVKDELAEQLKRATTN